MDFMNRGNRPVQSNAPAASTDTGLGGPKNSNTRSSKLKDNKWFKIGNVAFLLAISVLILASVLSLVFAKDNRSYSEGNYVNTGKYQAVFINGGQVYFGKVTDLNSKYINLSDIYYLRVNQQVQPDQQNKPANANDVTLVKLGCELHGPEDSMVINREQVIFWENLKSDGQIAKGIADKKKAFPNGCADEQKQQTQTDDNANKNNANTNPNTNNTTGNTNR